jgi:hypothetical protein
MASDFLYVTSLHFLQLFNILINKLRPSEETLSLVSMAVAWGVDNTMMLQMMKRFFCKYTQ